MVKITLFIYIEAVLAFTLIPIQGKNVTCRHNDSILVGEQCYRRNLTPLHWKEARDECLKWNGKLATFTSLDHVREVFSALEFDVRSWVNSQNETSEKELQWTALHTLNADSFNVFSGSCYMLSYASLCTENINDLTPKTITNATTQADLTTNDWSDLTTTTKYDPCLHNDSISVDGQCFRLSSELLEWSNANIYCSQRNGTLATLSSVEQGIKIITAMNAFNKVIWITDSPEFHNGKLIYLSENNGCKKYEYNQFSSQSMRGQVLCVETSITDSERNGRPESTTTPNVTNRPEPTTEPELTTKPVMTRRPELTTSIRSTQTTRCQDQRVNRNRLLILNPLLYMNRHFNPDLLRDQNRIPNHIWLPHLIKQLLKQIQPHYLIHLNRQ